MSPMLSPEKLVDYLKPIIASCNLWAGKKLSVLIIANPMAGDFTIKSRSMQDDAVLKLAANAVKSQNPCVEITDILLHKTKCAGDANVTTAAFIDNLLGKNEIGENGDEYLIITAAGDGTSLEVQTALAHAAFSSPKAFLLVTKKITILRLPLGTGNDGTDGRILVDSLCRLTSPAQFVLRSAVKVHCNDGSNSLSSTATTKGRRKKIKKYGSLSEKSPWYAFNIASVGIDAFITHMTNKTKNLLPGNFYKLWIDLACLFYDLQFPSKPVDIEVFDDKGTSVLHTNEPISFCLVGASGHRTYGSGQRILPDHRSICIGRKMSILTKLIMKKKVAIGEHTTSDNMILVEGEKIIVNYDQYLLTQMDGEVHLLCPEYFPITIERTVPVIRGIENI